MKFWKWFVALWVTLALVACGGGGGSAGTQAAGSGDSGAGTDNGTGTTVAAPTAALELVDSKDAALPSPTLSQTEARYLKVTLRNAKKELQAYKRVTVTLDNDLATLTPQSGSQLTGQDGVAKFAVAPSSVNSYGAVTATVKASVDGVEVSQSLDLQISAANVALSGLSVIVDPDLDSVQLGQSVNVTVDVKVNNQTAPSNSVAVEFSTACGTVTPATALVGSNGKASAVIQTSSVGDKCLVFASAAGAAPLDPVEYKVTAPPITGIRFVETSEPVIYQAGSVGKNQSNVSFMVIDSVGKSVAGQKVKASLSNTTGGVSFCGAPDIATSDSNGTVSFSVCAGTQPETVQVRATLFGTKIFTDSNKLTIQTGLPTQRFFDIAADRLNFYAGGRFTSQFSGNSVSITVRLADRQGNPVPNGTPVVFVTEGGQINSSNASSCIVIDGGCTVKLIGQEYRPLGSANVDGSPLGDPRPGRVTVLAMADGEESFIDANNNNRYDLGEWFEDLGMPFMDKNEDAVFTELYRNLIIGTAEGEVTYVMPPGSTEVAGTGKAMDCPDNSNVGLSQAGTCNGIWNGSGAGTALTKVRRSIVIVFSGGEIGLPGSYDTTIPSDKRTATLTSSNAAIAVRLADLNGNPLPADAKLSVGVRPAGGSSDCTAKLLGDVIGNSIEPTNHVAILEKCVGGESVDFKVEVAGGKVSQFTVPVPAPAP
ncbi:MAG: hypothetical protein RLZZ555_191 [Pseudomonadota bacterium]|jgi:hypothetical protein